jgi:hypothetical protein
MTSRPDSKLKFSGIEFESIETKVPIHEIFFVENNFFQLILQKVVPSKIRSRSFKKYLSLT